MIISKFQGVVFEVLKLELDKRGFGEEFLVTDKPSARGYQHSLLPSSSLDTGSSIAGNASSVNSQRKASNDIGHFPKVIIQCSLTLMMMVNVTSVNFSELFQQEFTYPRWYGIPDVYSFNADSRGEQTLIPKLTGNFVDTLWNDQTYKFAQIRDRIQALRQTPWRSLNNMPEFDLGISATRFSIHRKTSK